jgi:tetratricopeptide (TPR) repeat protein
MALRIVILMLICSSLRAQGTASDRLFEEGMNSWRNADYPKALDVFNALISQYPNYLEAYYYRAATREQNEDLSGAYLDYRMYLDKHPNNTEALLSYGLLCYRLKYFEESEHTFLLLLELPAGPTSRLFYETSGKGVTNIITTQSNIHGMYYYYLGLIDHARADFQRAVAFYDTAISMLPNKADYYVDRGAAMQALGNLSEFQQNLRKALETEPTHERANFLMGKLMEGADPEIAADYYTQSIEAFPENPAPYRQRGFNRMKAGDLKGALQDFSKAIKLDPGEPTSYINRGIIREKMRQYEHALKDFSRAIDLSPSDARAYLNRGNVLYKLREFENALNDYSVALIYSPGYPAALYQRGLANYQLGRRSDACADLTSAIENGAGYARRAFSKICPSN